MLILDGLYKTEVLSLKNPNQSKKYTFSMALSSLFLSPENHNSDFFHHGLVLFCNFTQVALDNMYSFGLYDFVDHISSMLSCVQ